MQLSLRALVVVVFTCLAATPAAAQSQLQLQQQLKGSDGAKPPFPLHLNASLTEAVGSGTFVASPWNPTFSSTLTLTPLIAWQGFTFLLNQSYSLEHTQSNVTSTPYQVEMSDPTLLARYMKFRGLDGALLVLPTLGYQLPLSMASRQSGSLGTATFGLRNIYNLNDLGLSFYAAANAGYALLVPSLANRFLAHGGRPLQDRTLGAITTVTCNPRNQLELSNYGCHEGRLPQQWRWGAGIGGAWFGFNGAIAVNADLTYGQSFSVRTGPDDALKAEDAVAGLVPRQSTAGNLSVSYIPLPWLFFTLGASSFQGALTADGKGLRFPFWDFVSPYNNNSQVYLDTTISL
ncbi:MAG: hypothetical protein FJ137_06650 [Deltaproteobacteria bacterium]|nr:hypothetical protein [Deltaproteobacteria bacterium]